MAFYADTIIFDSIPSEFYNLFLGEINGAGEASTATSQDISLLTQKLYRRPIPLFWGSEQTPVLTFPLSLYSPDEIMAPMFSKISQWLFGAMNYKRLIICQPDMQNIFFQCFLTAPQIVRTGNLITGTTCTVVCNAPWGWTDSWTYSYDYTDIEFLVSDSVIIDNESANNFYTYPTVTATANIFGGYLDIINTSDANRDFHITLSPYEIITIDCDNQIITSSIENYPIQNFNKNWLRFIPGFNYLTVTGMISSLEITNPQPVKIGG